MPLVLVQAKIEKSLRDRFQQLFPYWGATTYLIECALRQAIEQKEHNEQLRIGQLNLKGSTPIVDSLKKEENGVKRSADAGSYSKVEEKSSKPEHSGSKGTHRVSKKRKTKR